MSDLEEALAWQLRAVGFYEDDSGEEHEKGYVRELVFAPPRRWRADFAFPRHKLLVECDGGTWVQGRHTRPQGFARDAEKMNAAQLLGYRVLRFTGEQVRSGEALALIEQALSVGETSA